MVESLETKINYIIILDDGIYEIFLRGENDKKEKGNKNMFWGNR